MITSHLTAVAAQEHIAPIGSHQAAGTPGLARYMSYMSTGLGEAHSAVPVASDQTANCITPSHAAGGIGGIGQPGGTPHGAPLAVSHQGTRVVAASDIDLHEAHIFDDPPLDVTEKPNIVFVRAANV